MFRNPRDKSRWVVQQGNLTRGIRQDKERHLRSLKEPFGEIEWQKEYENER